MKSHVLLPSVEGKRIQVEFDQIFGPMVVQNKSMTDEVRKIRKGKKEEFQVNVWVSKRCCLPVEHIEENLLSHQLSAGFCSSWFSHVNWAVHLWPDGTDTQTFLFNLVDAHTHTGTSVDIKVVRWPPECPVLMCISCGAQLQDWTISWRLWKKRNSTLPLAIVTALTTLLYPNRWDHLQPLNSRHKMKWLFL